MKYVFLVSKENIALAKEEVLSLVNSKLYKLDKNLLILDINLNLVPFLANRLAYTKKIFRLLFSCKEKNLIKNMQNFNWQKIYKENFALRTENNNYSEKELAGFIWRKLKNPRVNLSNPKTAIFLFFAKNIYCCLLEKEISHNFEQRKAHKRPELHPSSLHPRLARILINLTGIKEGIILDPFCGSGGILIEAGLIGIKSVGYDIDQIMLNRAKINLDYFKIKNYKLERRDSSKITKKIDYIVSDLPYGLNTSQKNLYKLYNNFLSALRKILKIRAVIIFPDFKNKQNIDYISLMRRNNLRIISQFNYYIHKSLSKKIFVLE